MTSRDDVILAYRLMLGREPESEDVILNLSQNTHSIPALREAFLKSPEFIQRTGELIAKPSAVRQRHPFTLPRIPVEVDVPQDDLERMFTRVQSEWERLGSTEPYWSVVTQPQYYRDSFDAHRAQFYSSGHFSCQVFLSALARCRINRADLSTCLEVGCGVGRVTAHLAKAFDRVIAADISSPHLELAANHVDQGGHANVEFRHWSAVQDLLAIPQVDAIYSVITLQHNPPPVSAWMLRTLLEKLRRGGAAYLQIATYRNGYLFESIRYLNSPVPDSLEMHFLPQQDVFRIVAEAGCECLEVREDEMVGDEDKMLSNSFLIRKR